MPEPLFSTLNLSRESHSSRHSYVSNVVIYYLGSHVLTNIVGPRHTRPKLVPHAMRAMHTINP